MSFRYGIALFACLIFFNPAFAQGNSPDSIAVERAIALVMENHPAIRRAQQGIAASDARIEQSRSGYYPDISGLGSYTRVGPVPSFDIPGQGTIDLAPANNYNFNIELRQTVFDFGRRSAAVDLAESGRESAVEGVESVRLNLAYQTVDLFLSILFLRENISVIDKQLGVLNEHLDIIRKKIQAGTATDFDVLTTEVRIANTRGRKVDALAALQKQEIMFRELTGLSPEGPLVLKGDFSVAPVDIGVDSLISLAMKQLPEAKLSRCAESAAELQLSLASLGNRPTLAVNALFGFKNGYQPDLDELNADWVLGLQVRAPIFNGFLTRGRKHQAVADLNSARLHSRNIKLQVSANVQQAFVAVAASREKLDTAEPQVAQAEQAVSLARIRYKAGTATNLDLLDAETALIDARLIRLKAKFDLAVSRYALDRAIGVKIW